MHVELVIMPAIMAATSMNLALSLAAILGLANDLADMPTPALVTCVFLGGGEDGGGRVVLVLFGCQLPVVGGDRRRGGKSNKAADKQGARGPTEVNIFTACIDVVISIGIVAALAQLLLVFVRGREGGAAASVSERSSKEGIVEGCVC